MKKNIIRLISLALSAIIALPALASCTKNMKTFDGDLRERYDYNLNEYLKAGKYKGLKVKVGADNISDRELQAKIMEYTVLYTATVKEWTRLGEDAAAQRGNIAEVKFQGYLDGEPMSDLVNLKEEGYSMSLGADMLIEGIDEHIIGMKIGDKKTVEITVPDPCYDYPNYVGKKLTFDLELAGIRATELEPYDEGLFEYYGCTTADEFEAQVISEIKRIRNENLEDYVVTRALAMTVDSFEVKKYPDKELSEISESVRAEDTAAAKEAGVSFDDYISSEYGITAEEYDADLKEYAENFVFHEMVIYYIARNEQIGLTNAAFDEKATELAEEYGFTTPSEYMSYMASSGYTEYAVREMIWSELVADLIFKNTEQVKEG